MAQAVLDYDLRMVKFQAKFRITTPEFLIFLFASACLFCCCYGIPSPLLRLDDL